MPDGEPEESADAVIAALSAAGVDELLTGEDGKTVFFKIQEAANTTEDRPTKQGLQLLTGVSSMMLDGDQWDSPYGPWYNIGTQRGMIPEDLSPRDLDVLRWVAENVVDRSLSSRAADLVWLQSNDRRADISFARLAVEKWSGVPVTADSWARSGRDELARAVSVANRLRLTDEMVQIQDSLIGAMGSTDVPWFAASVADFLAEHALIGSRLDEILEGIERALTELSPELHAAEALLSSKAKLLRGADRPEDAAEADEAHVEALLAEADRRSSDSHLVEAHFLELAYQKARRIPRKHRSERVVNLIAEMPTRIREAGEAGLDEMSVVESSADITDAVRQVRDSVRGKSVEDALAAMVGYSHFANFDKAKAEAEKSMEGTIAGFFGGSTFASDGRKVDSTEVDNYYDLPSNLWHRMLFLYDLRISGIAVGVVVPAMEIITTEHRLRLADLRYLVGEASIVPPHVKELFALGLYYGTRHEWVAALHILAPQIESLVRYHLREAGVDTERIDTEHSISTETGLSTLMKSPVADEIFGPDLAWEIRALLCGPTGPNLRNLVAHGLVGFGIANGPHAIYLWWIAMQLVFIPYYNKLRSQQTAQSADDANDEDDDSTDEPVDDTPDAGASDGEEAGSTPEAEAPNDRD